MLLKLNLLLKLLLTSILKPTGCFSTYVGCTLDLEVHLTKRFDKMLFRGAILSKF